MGGPLQEWTPNSPFSLRETLKSGQLFHWEPHVHENIAGYAACLDEHGPAWIAQLEDGRILTRPTDLDRIVPYFGLAHPMDEIHASFPANDPVLEAAMAFAGGIRITRQPIWECLATFITSSMKQVAHIRAMSLKLRHCHGTSHRLDGRTYHSYPLPSVLASAGEEALRACSLGYRARFLHRAALDVVEGKIHLSDIQQEADLLRARQALLGLHGVGEKIAHCVLLFSCGQWGAFPIDVWMERILHEKYGVPWKGKALQCWAEDHFGPHAGYAQQYLFHFARKNL